MLLIFCSKIDKELDSENFRMILQVLWKIYEKILEVGHFCLPAPIIVSKGPETKKIKKKTKKQKQEPSCSSHLNKGTENIKELNIKAQKTKAIR